MSSRSVSAREYESSDQFPGHSASPPVPNSSETEGLIFYHMDLYGSNERFDIFPEEPSGQGSRFLGNTRRKLLCHVFSIPQMPYELRCVPPSPQD